MASPIPPHATSPQVALPSRPTAFALRSVSNPSVVHRLALVTFIGRSEAKLRRDIDICLAGGDSSVSRVHCHLQVHGSDAIGYQIFVVDENSQCGTDVDGVPCEPGVETPISVGQTLRLGLRELWQLERRALTTSIRPQKGTPAPSRVMRSQREVEHEDAPGWFTVRIESISQAKALQRCSSWMEFVDVATEMCTASSGKHDLIVRNQAVPCCDAVIVLSEAGEPIDRGDLNNRMQTKVDLRSTKGCTFLALTFHEMENFPVEEVQKLIDGPGQFVRMRVCEDPRIIARCVERREQLAEEEKKRIVIDLTAHDIEQNE